MMIPTTLFAATTLLLSTAVVAQNSAERGYLDRFTYQELDITRPDNFVDYAPQNWNAISCDEGSQLDKCLGYRDKWETGRGWSIQKNYCRWCPESDPNSCSRHHQSPIDLRRQVGYEPGTHEEANECIDVHWMKYEDSFCTWDQLIQADAFTIERHALRISQPITVFDNLNDDTDGVRDGVTLNCRIPGRGSRFGRIDYSKGFSHWWHLSHIDIHTPSEHTQNGIRYDAEIQLQHFYSVTAAEAGVNNELGTVAVFMNAYEDAAPYRYLDKLICQWRRKEFEVRTECGLDPIESSYPGCFPLKRNLRRNMAEDEKSTKTKAATFQTAQDVILHNDQHRDSVNHSNVKIFMEEGNWAPAEEKDWDAWIAEQSKKMQDEEELYNRMRTMEHGGNHTDALHEQFRKLVEYDEIEWFNYWPMLGVRTEYYFRYSGSQTIPPCYGNFQENTRAGANHWRVMKDPIRIHPRQLQELRRLLADRIAPKGSSVDECRPDTAAKVQRDGNHVIDVNTARPLMSWKNVHFKTFCECKDWPSKWPEDRNWCKIEDINERFFDKMYNFGW
ncbi:Eukaryotic-type carbonic anhydrase [Nitzschia inconspicua]|uniref:Eukaryotic-type carbonic anhydrase n=1 Tax=Nitzschia inconspicua TaxID=303405 RepID=A0A9K3KGL8_9STRA|nr:Eukaryotic-type carbonic anhydrase [Nitzschia inconspicua]